MHCAVGSVVLGKALDFSGGCPLQHVIHEAGVGNTQLIYFVYLITGCNYFNTQPSHTWKE